MIFTREQEKFIVDNSGGMDYTSLTALLNETYKTAYTVRQVRSRCYFKKIDTVKGFKPTPAMVAWLRKNAKGRQIKHLVSEFNAQFKTDIDYVKLRNIMGNRDIRTGLVGNHGNCKGQKRKPYIRKGGNFKRWDNEGNRLDHLNRGGGVPGFSGNRTDKRGKPPSPPVGTEKVVKKSGGGQYVIVKVSENGLSHGVIGTWKRKTRLVWEAANGPIPAGYNVLCLNGNNLDCSLENLAIATTNEICMLNTQKLVDSDPKITEMFLTVIRHRSAIYAMARGNNAGMTSFQKHYLEKSKREAAHASTV